MNVKNKYLELVKKVAVEKFGVEPAEIHPDSYFEEDLNISELDLNEMLLELEEKLHIDLVDEKDNISSVQDLLDILIEKLE